MKRNLLAITLTAVALACLAGLDYSDIVKWGLVRRSDVAALLPAEGYRAEIITNRTPSYVWRLSGYIDAVGDPDPYTVLSVTDVEIAGLAKNPAINGMSALIDIGNETGFYVGGFEFAESAGVGVFSDLSDPLNNGYGAWTGGGGNGDNPIVMNTAFNGNTYYCQMTLVRTDNPDIVTVTTNYYATGGGAVLRDSRNPRKTVRLVDGALLLLEEIPAHWVFQGVPCFALSNPLTSFSGNLAGYTWATETAGDPPYLYYALYDENSMRKFATDSFTGVTASLSFYPDFEPYEVVQMIYVGPSVTTNSL